MLRHSRSGYRLTGFCCLSEELRPIWAGGGFLRSPTLLQAEQSLRDLQGSKAGSPLGNRKGSEWRPFFCPAGLGPATPQLPSTFAAIWALPTHSLNSGGKEVGEPWHFLSWFSVVPDPLLLSKIPVTAQSRAWEVFPLGAGLGAGPSARLRALPPPTLCYKWSRMSPFYSCGFQQKGVT